MKTPGQAVVCLQWAYGFTTRRNQNMLLEAPAASNHSIFRPGYGGSWLRIVARRLGAEGQDE